MATNVYDQDFSNYSKSHFSTSIVFLFGVHQDTILNTPEIFMPKKPETVNEAVDVVLVWVHGDWVSFGIIELETVVVLAAEVMSDERNLILRDS